jgi:FkbM family methyltransferase
VNKLKRLVYMPEFLRVLRALRLTEAARNLHYRWATESGGVFRTRICGVEARFRTSGPRELVQVEFNLALEQEILEIVVGCLQQGDVFMDAGANIGIFTVMAALIVGERGQVLTFEPETGAFAKLQRNLEVNGFQNVRAFKVALSDTDGQGQLYVDRPAPSLMASGQSGQGSERVESVEIASGDNLCKAHRLPVPRVVKIDVEGFEYLVLQGLRGTLSQPATELVVCEVHPYLLPTGTTPEMIKGFLKSLGFDDVAELPRREEIQMIARKEPAGHGAN